MTQRDVVFLVADGSMEQMLRGFFGRQQFHRTRGCGRFEVDPDRDLIVAPRRDSQVFRRGPRASPPVSALARPGDRHARRRLGWQPGLDVIKERVSKRLAETWDESAVVVIDPELEAWVWQDNPNVPVALGAPSDSRRLLDAAGHWPDNQRKPTDPKEALEYLRTRHGADRSKAVFRRVAERVSVGGCVDPAFLHLRDTLRDWFPEDSL